MGDQSRLNAFVADDTFLRRIANKRLVRDGEVGFEAFRPRSNELNLSFTFQDETLSDEAALDEYHRRNALNSGDLPGVCRLTHYDLTASLEPPLPPRFDPDTEDEFYGHLHCVTDLPANEEQMVRMAKLATKNGMVRPFVRSKRR